VTKTLGFKAWALVAGLGLSVVTVMGCNPEEAAPKPAAPPSTPPPAVKPAPKADESKPAPPPAAPEKKDAAK
jgi:hypothetical protein